jgi:hypothetical protein
MQLQLEVVEQEQVAAQHQEQMVKILFLQQLHQQVVEVVVQDLLTVDKLVDQVVEEVLIVDQVGQEILLLLVLLKVITVELMLVVEVVLVQLVLTNQQEVIQDQVDTEVVVLQMIF